METRPFTHAAFNAFLNEGKLMASRCNDKLYLPPRAICPETFSDQMEWVELSGKGKLVAFTCVHIAPTAMLEQGYDRNNPYCTGIVELDEGVKISAQILGVDASQPETIEIGTPLAVEFVERQGTEQKFLAFRAI